MSVVYIIIFIFKGFARYYLFILHEKFSNEIRRGISPNSSGYQRFIQDLGKCIALTLFVKGLFLRRLKRVYGVSGQRLPNIDFKTAIATLELFLTLVGPLKFFENRLCSRYIMYFRFLSKLLYILWWFWNTIIAHILYHIDRYLKLAN